MILHYSKIQRRNQESHLGPLDKVDSNITDPSGGTGNLKSKGKYTDSLNLGHWCPIQAPATCEVFCHQGVREVILVKQYVGNRETCYTVHLPLAQVLIILAVSLHYNFQSFYRVGH